MTYASHNSLSFTFLDTGIARQVLKIIDNELERYKREAGIPALK